MPVDRVVEKVQLFFSAKDLPSMQMFSKTDAFLGVILHDSLTDRQRLVALTEVLQDTTSPKWTKTHTMDYFFETVQEVTLRVFQQGDTAAELKEIDKHRVIGDAHFRMSELMKNAHHLVLPLVREDGSKTEALVDVYAEAVIDCRDVFRVTINGHKLRKKGGFFGHSNPFCTISRMNEDNTSTQVHRSEVKEYDLNPKWSEAKIPMVTLCNGDYERPLLIEIHDQNKNDKSMGTVRTSARALLASNGGQLTVIEKKRQDRDKSYVNSGAITAENCHVEHHPTFTQFLKGGLEVSLVVAIDFTGSNGDPDQTTSLHYIDPAGAKLNAYEEAIIAVGRVLEPYDTDKQYPVYGFGARVKDEDGEFTKVQHGFQLNPAQLEVHGVPGVLDTYRNQVGHLMFSGPTLIAPIIEATAARSQCTATNQKYTVLLILTDGTINDMDETKAALIAASHKAMSVIIVGVGNADFTDMRVLDNDKKTLLSAGGQTAVRDIVQFVTYNDAAARGAAVLAQQVLAEVPDQVLLFMEQNGILPGEKKK